MKYFSIFATDFLTRSKKVAYSISRILEATPKNPETREISTVEIRDIGSAKHLTVDITSMRDLGQLYRFFVNKSKKRSPVACNTERKKADKWRREVLGMQQRVIGISSQTLNKNSELTLLRLRESSRVFMKLRVEYYFKHLVCLGARRGTSSRSRSVSLGCGWRLAELGAQIPDDIRPLGLFRQCLWQTSEACALLFRGMRWSYVRSIPNRNHLSI